MDRAYLAKAFEIIGRSKVRYVHLSCHGGSKGIWLTTTPGHEPIGWRDLDELAWPHLKDKVLVISACNVKAGAKQLFELHRTFCAAIIAPNRDIEWAEGLAAYAAFYHRATKRSSLDEDVDIINAIVDGDPFEVFYSTRMGEVPRLGR